MSLLKRIFKDVLGGLEKSLVNSTIQIGGDKGPASTGAIQAGDVNILSLVLVSENQQRAMDLIDHVKAISIYESIMSPVVMADLEVADSIGMLQNFPIIGEEYVNIVFQTPDTSLPATYNMRVNRVKDKKVTDNSKMVTYVLECVSMDLFKNSSNMITREFNAPISDIVKDILENELHTQKPMFIEETRGVEKSLVTLMQPFKAIDFFRRRAVSKKYVSSSFVFFENRYGYNFTTMEKLFESGSKFMEKSDKVFFFDPTSQNFNAQNVTIRNILAYNQATFFDSVSKIQSGGITNVVNRFDILTGDIVKINYTNNESQDKFKLGDQTPVALNSSGFDSTHGRNPAVFSVVPYNSDKPESFLPEKLSILRAFVQRIAQNIIQIHIYGDTDISVGDVITCYLPAATGMTEDPENARLDSGNYLVTKVRHIIINSDRPQHTIALELVKGSFLES